MRRRIFPNLLGDVSSLEERQARLERVLQVIGFSPELPYTMTVNDGTRNTVSIGLVDGVYGIKLVDNAGNEVILANGTIVANAIKTGTLDCSLITVENLDAGSIITGTLSADFISGGILDFDLITAHAIRANKITAGQFIDMNSLLSIQAIHGEKVQIGTLNADRIEVYSIKADNIDTNAIESDKIAAGAVIAIKINVVDLSAINANLGSITAGNITGVTITGGTIRTSVSGKRVVLDGNNQVRLYSPDGNMVQLDSVAGSQLRLNCSEFVSTGSMSITGHIMSGDIYLGWPGEGNIFGVDKIEGYDDIRSYVTGTNKAIWYSTSGGGDLSFFPYWGDFYSTGTKHFRIPHPDDPDNQWLQYVSVEAPEVALKIRGVAKLNSGGATVKPPHHWELATEQYLTTVQLTPLEDCNGLYAPKSTLENTSFKVKELQGGVSNAEFMWELTATRKGYSDFEPEQTIDTEAKKVAESLASNPQTTKKKHLEIEAKRTKKRQDFQELVKEKYKKIAGKELIDRTKEWVDKDRIKLEKEIKKQVEIQIAMEEVFRNGN